jgi:RNase P protein component
VVARFWPEDAVSAGSAWLYNGSMLPRSKRLSSEQLDLVMKTGKVVHTPSFWLRIIKNEGQTRFSAIVPQKIASKASQRVGYRRKMYNAIALICGSLPLSGYQMVLCLKTKTEKDSLLEEVKEIFVKAGLIK